MDELGMRGLRAVSAFAERVVIAIDAMVQDIWHGLIAGLDRLGIG
jgi:hypothetical protein